MSGDSHILRQYDPPPPLSTPSPSSNLVQINMSSAAADAEPCLIPEKCLTSAKRSLPRDKIKINILSCGSTTTKTGYFRCVCARAQSLGNNEYFSAHCVFQECVDDGKKRAFMKLYQEGCKQLGNSLADIPNEWAPFVTPLASISSIPPTSTTSHDNALTSAISSKSGESSSVSGLTISSTSTATTSSTTSPPVSSSKHASSTAIIAGSTISAAVLLALLISLLKLYWSTKKKAKKIQVANGQLQDATNPDGVSQHMSALMNGASVPHSVSGQMDSNGRRDNEVSAYGSEETRDGGEGEGTTSGTIGFPYARYESVGYEPDQRDLSISRCTSYNVQQQFSGDIPSVEGGRRMSEYSESDYGSTRRRSLEDLLASGAHEVRPLRVEKKGLW